MIEEFIDYIIFIFENESDGIEKWFIDDIVDCWWFVFLVQNVVI